ncbi:carboxypeptidase-like regulatory domain-containing protein [Croceitalea vernalis]|uniref:Carboxypeptidase-like regulatory domain-containing protein n=1 Tax=Croceitalea vernalis TaxID=3075599 RepID=A0ABU3BGN7_9FLAO|nr:carboxypeptidase-like regulatory domain-containing protein [Croceitalea sp. P007]MDT0621336.1 carboxypeptidase-like regulatory domain-containing protein [Croceitalea sp. P007]
MKKLLFLFLAVPLVIFAQEQRKLSGTISSDYQVLPDVKVTVVDKEIVTASNQRGWYEIAVETGDKVQFSSIGMKTITIMVEDVTRILNLEMSSETTDLEEVVVTKKLNKSQELLEKEFRYNPDIVKSVFRYFEPKRFVGQTRMINMDGLEHNSQCILDLLTEQLDDISRIGTCAGDGKIFIGLNSIKASPITVFDIDGQVFQDVPFWLDLRKIKRIAIVQGRYWANYYGDAALNGVVIINTTDLNALRGVVDKGRLRDNYIKEANLSEQYHAENKRRKQNQKVISGTVSDGRAPIANVNISVSNTNEATTTNEKGKYKIRAGQGDIISYSYVGLKTVNIKVEDITRILNPILIPEVTQLDEVEVTASKRRSQKDLEEDYYSNENIIKTAWGYLDADRAAGNVRFLNEEQINPVSLCILDLLRGKFAGVNVTGDCFSGGGVSIRGLNSIMNNTGAIFDVDGQIFTNAPIWLDVNSFKRIAILSNLGLTAQYGNFGRGGVVVINTTNGTLKTNNGVDQALLRNNFVSGRILTKEDIDKNKPQYLKELEASTSFEGAKGVFDKHAKAYKGSPYFHLDAYTYFTEKWKQQKYADGIIKNNYALFQNNAVLLKALAYHFDAQERFEMANTVYKEAFLLRPNYAQSYLDMANTYRDINEPKMAASMYARYQYLLEEGFMQQDTIGFGPIIEREFNNLLTLDKSAVVHSEKANELYIAEEDFAGTRLVFEWNDSEAEFDLQFVNPGKQFYTWNHSLADNEETISREKNFGYNITEYLIDGSLPGNWSVNVNYLGNKSLTPTYLKATIYYAYGSRNQRKEVKVFKLSLKDVNQELFRLQSFSKVAVR